MFDLINMVRELKNLNWAFRFDSYNTRFDKESAMSHTDWIVGAGVMNMVNGVNIFELDSL